MKKAIEKLRQAYGSYRKVAELLEISERHLYGIKSGDYQPSKRLKRDILELADTALPSV